MASDGWIKISRSINEHWIWKDSIKLKWWLDMLLTVNYKDNKVNIGNQLIDCKRGQSVMSLQQWAMRWKVDKNKVRNFFVLLENDGMITHENLLKTTRITICKYESYQSIENDNETQSKRNQNAIKTQPNPIEESKENKEGNKETILLKKETKKDFTQRIEFDFSKSSDAFKDYFLNEFIKAPKQKKKSKELQNKILIDLQNYDEPFSIELMKKAVLNNWQGYKFEQTDEQYANYLRKKQNGNNPQWTNGSIDGIQRTIGKQSHVFSGAEFSAEMQKRIENKGIFD